MAPKGTEKAGDETAEDQAEAGEQGETSGDENATFKRVFRMVAAFDISQTEGFDITAEDHEARTVEDPTAVLRETLTDQLERFGYTITTGDVPAAAVSDDDPPTVTVPPGASPVELARALGSVLSRPRKDRPEQRAAERNARSDAACITKTTRDDGARRIRLSLGDDYGDATAWVRTHWETGATVYEVTGPRISGAFTISSADAADAAQFYAAEVHFGDWSERLSPTYEIDAPELPTINGVTVVGGRSAITPTEIPDFTHRNIGVRRPTGRNTSTAAPDRTSRRAAAVVRAIVADWLTRDDLDRLHTARARYKAPTYRGQANHEVSQIEQQLARLTAQRDQAAEKAARFDAIASTPPVTADTP